MLKSNLHPIPLLLPYWGYEMSRGCSLSRDLLTAKTTSVKARKIENSTRKNKPDPSGVAMSELSNGTKKHTSKSQETIHPFKWLKILYSCVFSDKFLLIVQSKIAFFWANNGIQT
jgi:hypothetical protein